MVDGQWGTLRLTAQQKRSAFPGKVRVLVVGRQNFARRKFCQLAVVSAADFLLFIDEVKGYSSVDTQQFAGRG